MSGRNIRGGNKFKKGKTGRKRKDNSFPYDIRSGDMFAGVTKKYGDRHLEVLLQDGRTAVAYIPGKYWKKVWFNVGDIIVVCAVTPHSDMKDETTDGTTEILGKIDRNHKDFNYAVAEIEKSCTTDMGIKFGGTSNADAEDDDIDDIIALGELEIHSDSDEEEVDVDGNVVAATPKKPTMKEMNRNLTTKRTTELSNKAAGKSKFLERKTQRALADMNIGTELDDGLNIDDI